VTEPFTDVCDVVAVDPERVSHVQSRLPGVDEAANVAELLGAFADPARLRIIAALTVCELCVCDLSAALHMPQSSVSHHLRTLRSLRLARARRDGRLVYYSLDDTHVERLFALALEHVREKGR
jgi:ArsR family transcriptional regulator